MNDPRTTANDFIHENISDQKKLTTKAKMKCQKMVSIQKISMFELLNTVFRNGNDNKS